MSSRDTTSRQETVPRRARPTKDTQHGSAGQLPVELILLRQAASYLEMPIFLVDAEGRLVYFNEPAEPLLGSRFDEVGEMSMRDWVAAFRPSRRRGRRLPPDEVPLIVALTAQRPVHATLEITGLDSVRRPIEATALPLRGPHSRLLGAIAIFWPVG
jgi:PAS domain-containing protein